VEALSRGQTTPVYLVDFEKLKLEKVPRENSNDYNPVWMGDTVYFLSDRNGASRYFLMTQKRKVKHWSRTKGLD